MSDSNIPDKLYQAIKKLALEDRPLFIVLPNQEAYDYWLEKYGDGSPEHPFKDGSDYKGPPLKL